MRVVRVFWLWMLLLPCLARAQAPAGATIVGREGRVEIARAGTDQWSAARINQTLFADDRVRTGAGARALLRLSDRSVIRVGPGTVIKVPADPKRRGFDLLRGIIYFFHRDNPGEVPVRTPTVYAVVLGTEFEMDVADTGETRVRMVDGAVELTTTTGTARLGSGQEGWIVRGEAPRRTAMIGTWNQIQWGLYYPAVVDPVEFAGLRQAVPELALSLTRYTAGDLLGAWAAYPAGRRPEEDEERIYLAALLLGVGDVGAARANLASLGEPDEDGRVRRLRVALETVIRAVTLAEGLPEEEEEGWGSSMQLARSYYWQSRLNVREALRSARRAVEVSPSFAFAWARVGELEFGFGRVERAAAAVERSLALAPDNAAAVTVSGFLLAAGGRIREALAEFERAIVLDGAVGDAWLGRGLCRIRRGDVERGLQDLESAVALEPQRAVLRSYLGKAFQAAGEGTRAVDELRLAEELDGRDPTAWLYEALLLHQRNRPNAAIERLELSQELNDNRALYRSGLLLDQDRAVRGVNLAVLYEDVGMEEVSRWEAARAVAADPGNFSAHLFLANSHQALRDPSGFDARFETATVSEYLQAGVLAPPGAGTLAQSVSRLEYSKLFERDGVGVAGQAEYRSHGGHLLSGAQYGRFGNMAYALSAWQRWDNGQRVNNDVERGEQSVQWKHQITPRDGVYVRAIRGTTEGGDLARYYDPTAGVEEGGPAPGFRFDDEQEPLVLVGYHREWGPGRHTLALASWLNDDYRAANPTQRTLVLERAGNGEVTHVDPISIEQIYRNEFEVLGLELQQIWQGDRHALIVGGRHQGGDFRTRSRQENADSPFAFLFPDPDDTVDSDMDRWAAYAYYRWEPIRQVRFHAGVSYDRLTFPGNFRYAPIAQGQRHRDEILPKGGVVWVPDDRTTVRAGYARSLGGVSFEQSFRLEPTEVAGFNQAFRSLIPESVAGGNAAALFTMGGLSIERRWGSGTYVGVSGEWLESDLERSLGVFHQEGFVIDAGQTTEALDYRERSIALTVNQLVGEPWALGGRYRVSWAELENDFVEVSDGATTSGGFRARNDLESILHQVKLWLIYQSRHGFHGRVESVWHSQGNHGFAAAVPGDEFWQFNALAGYRFFNRRWDMRVGILNLTDQDYRLHPLNWVEAMPRGRTLLVASRFNF